MGGSNGFLALGLGIGLLVNYLSGDYDISLMTLLAFVAMYPLGIAFVMVMRRSMQGVRPAADGSNLGGRLRRSASHRMRTLLPTERWGGMSRRTKMARAETKVRSIMPPTLPMWQRRFPKSEARSFRSSPIGRRPCIRLPNATGSRSAKRKYARILCAVVPQSVLPKSFSFPKTPYGRTRRTCTPKRRYRAKTYLMNLFEDEAFGR